MSNNPQSQPQDTPIKDIDWLLPDKKPPSDPKWHNKEHIELKLNYDDDGNIVGHSEERTTYLKTFDDGWNAAIDEVKKTAQPKLNQLITRSKIDELEKLLNDSEWLDVGYDPNDPTSVDHSEQAIIADTVTDRIQHLKESLNLIKVKDK